MAEDLIFLDRPPLLFKIDKFMMRHRIRGAWRLFESLKRRGYFEKKVIRYEIARGISAHIPIYRPERRWDRYDLLHYEPELIELLVREAEASDAPLTIIDCGADLGLVSMLLTARLKRALRVIAFEPSEDEISLLRKNIGGLPVASEVIQAAVGDYTGRGELRRPEYDAYNQARYVEPAADGSFEVRTLDSLGLAEQDLLIKIDVEGGEKAVIRGAKKTIANAHRVIVATEAHPLVAARTGIDPISVLGELAAIRPFRFIVCETGQTNLDLSRPFFEQLPEKFSNINVVAVSI
ncbi:MAG: FkbM family methyltransferase [Acidobacteria bacterium]|nr:FkbM family methyltransferase [Acidobacteriota bacterium]